MSIHWFNCVWVTLTTIFLNAVAKFNNFKTETYHIWRTEDCPHCYIRHTECGCRCRDKSLWYPGKIQDASNVQSRGSGTLILRICSQHHTFTLSHILIHAYYFPFKVSQDELELKANISQIWDDLFKEARQVDLSLTDVKRSFSVVRWHSSERCS